MVEIIEFKKWTALQKYLHKLPPVDLACRGQARDYNGKMKPKIDRCLLSLKNNLKDHLIMEMAVCQRFREHAPIYLSDVEQRYLKTRWLQLVVMQHYGAPTRLLDWTKSPWVAVFFAVSAEWESDGYVFGFRRKILEEYIQKKYKPQLKGLVWGPHPNDVDSSDRTWDLAKGNDKLFHADTVKGMSDWVTTFYSRESHFPRLITQQGLFTFASKPDLDHWKQISGLIKNDCFVLKICSEAKPDILRRLNIIGLNGATLFPGADGIGKSLEGLARVWHLPPRSSQFK